MNIESKIYLIRGERVVLDHDLAELYDVPTKRLKEQVRRNLERFPADFIFQLTGRTEEILRSQIATSRLSHGGTRYSPYAFTEHGVAMLSSVLHSSKAIEVNIAIVRAFIRLRQILNSDPILEKRLNELEAKYDGQFKVVFETIRKLLNQPQVPLRRIIGLDPNKK
jgi:hypothetical protein